MHTKFYLFYYTNAIKWAIRALEMDLLFQKD